MMIRSFARRRPNARSATRPIAVAALLALAVAAGGCSEDATPTASTGAPAPPAPSEAPDDRIEALLASAPDDFTDLLRWAERQIAVQPEPQPLPARPTLPEPKFPVIRLADEQRFRRADKQSAWTPRAQSAEPLVEIGPFRSDDPPSPMFAVQQAPRATADGESGLKLVMGVPRPAGADSRLQCEQVGLIVLELRVPWGRHVTLKWSKAGEIPLPIHSNTDRLVIPLSTEGLPDWTGPLKAVELITAGQGDGAVVVEKIRFMSRIDSYPAPIERKRVRVGSEIRSAMYAHSPAEIRYRNELLPPDARFTAFLAAEAGPAADSAELAAADAPPDAAATAAPSPVRFELVVEADGQAHTVLEQTVFPNQPWRHVSASLAEFAGRNVTLRLRTDCLDARTTAFWANPEIYQPFADAPFVVVYLVDTLAAEHIDLYGHPRQTMRVLGALAARGAWLANMVSNSSRTVESVPDLMLSMTTERHGVHHNLTPAPLELLTLPEVLRQAGFATASFVTNVYAGPRQNMDQGFDTFVDKIGFWFKPDSQLADRTVPLEETLAWIDAHADRPRFMYIHTAEPHAPYTPPSDFAGRFTAPAYDGPFDGTYGNPRTRTPHFHRARRPEDIQHIAALYDEEIAYADWRLGKFLAGLRDRDLLDRVNLFVTSDHGEEFLQHGAFEHGLNMHNEQTRVPLVACGPLVGAVGRIDTPASIVDIMPTVLDLLELPAPYALQGASLAPLLRSQPAGALAERTIFGSNHNYVASTGNVEYYAIEAGRWKLLCSDRPRPTSPGGPGSRFALFDLVADPRERSNVIAEHPDVARRLIARLLLWRQDQRPYDVEATAHVQSPADIATLQAMGYVGDGGHEHGEPLPEGEGEAQSGSPTTAPAATSPADSPPADTP